jgi:hypothetical protein
MDESIPAVSRFSPLARQRCCSKERSRILPSRLKNTALANVLRASPLQAPRQLANGHADRIRGGPLRAPATRMTAARNLRRFRQTRVRVDGYNQLTCQALDRGGSHPLRF